jgi:hypothetical protein
MNVEMSFLPKEVGWQVINFSLISEPGAHGLSKIVPSFVAADFAAKFPAPRWTPTFRIASELQSPILIRTEEFL